MQSYHGEHVVRPSCLLIPQKRIERKGPAVLTINRQIETMISRQQRCPSDLMGALIGKKARSPLDISLQVDYIISMQINLKGIEVVWISLTILAL